MLTKLKAYRVNEGLKLSDVSAKTGFTESKLSRIENGDTNIKLSDALLLCDLYHIDNPKDVDWYHNKN